MSCLVLATIPLIHPGLLELLRARKTRLGTSYRGTLMDRESRVRVLSGSTRGKMEDISGACGVPAYIN